MASNYTVTGQRQTTSLSNGSTFVPVMEVTFQTTSGTVGKVEIPLNQYNAANVKARVAAIEAVESL
jgi:hypothetical protein